MSLTERLQSELARLGSASHPFARTLPGIVDEYEQYVVSRNSWKRLSLLMTGGLLGFGFTIWIVGQRLDAISTRNEVIAAACLNPGNPVVTSKAAARAITGQIERRKEGTHP